MTARLKAGLMLLFMFVCMWLATNVLAYETTVMLLYTGSFGASAVYLFYNRARIGAFVKSWPRSFTYTVVIFYLCKVMAEKTINSTMGIESEYIKQSSIVGGFILSVPLSLILVSVYLFVRSAYMRCLAPFVGKFRAKDIVTEKADSESEGKEQEHFPGLRAMFAACVLCLAGFLLFHAENGIRYSVMLDAMKYSDCGPAERDIGYVRKNVNACYRFDTRMFKGSLVPTEISSKKPS